MAKGKTADYLRALRKKYGLGEYATGGPTSRRKRGRKPGQKQKRHTPARERAEENFAL